MVFKEVKTKEDAEYCQMAKVGDVLEGVLMEKQPSEKFGHVYKILQVDAEVPKFVLGTVHLEPKMFEVEVGQMVRLELVELRDTGKGNKMKVFKVSVDDGELEAETVK